MYSNDFLLSTANSLEGYRIVKQCGLVFGETVFKHNAFARIGAAISDTFDAMSFRSREMSGSMNLIETARNHAYEKMIQEAKRRGANAIIAIESDNTIGSDIMYISLYGTAVKVMPIEEYDVYKEDDQKKKELAFKQKETASKEQEENKTKATQRFNERKERGENISEVRFLADISTQESISAIDVIWKKYQLADLYPEIDKKIQKQAHNEQVYGKSPDYTKIFIEQIKVELTGEK